MQQATIALPLELTTREIARNSILISLLIVATLAVYWPVTLHEFVLWDDPMTIAGNPDFNPPSFKGWARYWQSPYLDLYIPVTYSFWAFVASIAYLPIPDEHGISLDPYAFHTANLLVHLASVALVFAILRILVPWEWGAFAGALLFGLHPVQVEPVAWVSGLKDTLAGMLSLAAIWQYLIYATRRQAGEEPRAWQIPYLMATVFFVLAMLSKPSAVTVPIIVGAIDLFLLRRSWEEVSSRGLWIWMLLALLFVVIGRMAQPPSKLPYVAPIVYRPFLAADALAFHLYHLVWPLKLCVDYGRSPDWSITQKWLYVTWIFPAALIAVGWHFRKRATWIIVSGIVFAAALLPVLSLLPFDFQYYSAVADRYMYVALLGPALLLGYILSRWRQPWLIATVAILLVFLGILSHRQAWVWRDTESLFTHTLKVNPRSLVAHMMLGNMELNQENLDRAVEHYAKAAETKPDDAGARFNWANVLVAQQKIEEALPHYKVAVTERPHDPDMRTNYGLALAFLGRLEEASQEFIAALAIEPDLEQARINLAEAQMQLATNQLLSENWAAAIPHYEEALRADPERLEAQLGLAEARRRLLASPRQ